MAEILLTMDDDTTIRGSPGSTISDSALTVARSAIRFQSEASTSGRLTTKTGIRELETSFKNLTKANAIKAERKVKRDFELKHKDSGIKVAGSLWSLDENGKMTQVRVIFPFPLEASYAKDCACC
jgi:hypothetical protein